MRTLRALLSALVSLASSLVGAVFRALSSAASFVHGAGQRTLRRIGRAASATGRGAAALLPREWKKPIAALFVVGLALVPVIYSGNMTWSFRDPSNHLNQITAAVVDLDEGATTTAADGTEEHIDVGAEFTENLLSKDQENLYRFVEVSPEEAARGLQDGTYGATIVVPETN